MLTITEYTNLSDFEFWSGAQDNAAMLTKTELDKVGEALADYREDGLHTEMELNDLFWFDFGFICELIGLEYDEDKDEVRR